MSVASPGKHRAPKAVSDPEPSGLGVLDALHVDLVFIQAPAVLHPGLHRSDPRASRKAGGSAGGGQEARFRRLLEYRGNSRLNSLKHVVTHLEELRGKVFNSQVGGDFPYFK